MAMDKQTFKICEAVHLGLEHYYMGPRDRRTVTEDDKRMAHKIIPTLPNKWWLTKHSWDAQKF